MQNLHAMPTAIRALKRPFFYGFLLMLMGTLSACDRLGFPDPAVEIAVQEANAKATGSACRHAGRAIEDCYSLNPKSSRAAIYAGWKEMNDYMRENKIEEVKPTMSSHSASSASASSEEASASASGEDGANASANSEASSKHE